MRIRAIAGVGVMLCVAMTSFSIYLGVIEHVYASPELRAHTLATVNGKEVICLGGTASHNTTTTSVAGLKVVSCEASRHSR